MSSMADKRMDQHLELPTANNNRAASIINQATEHSRFPGVFLINERTGSQSQCLCTKIPFSFSSSSSDDRIESMTIERILPQDDIDDENNNNQQENDDTTASAAPAQQDQYRVWNPFRSTIAASIVGGIETLFGFVKKNNNQTSNILYLGDRLTNTCVPLAEMLMNQNNDNNLSVSSSSSSSSKIVPVIFQDFDPSAIQYHNSRQDIKDALAAVNPISELVLREIDTDSFKKKYFDDNNNNSDGTIFKISNNTSSSSSSSSSIVTRPILIVKESSSLTCIEDMIHGGNYFQDIAEKVNNNCNNDDDQLFADTMIVEISGVDPKTIVENVVVPNAESFLKTDGLVVLLMNGDPKEEAPEVTYAKSVNLMKEHNFKPREQITLEPFFLNKAILVCVKK